MFSPESIALMIRMYRSIKMTFNVEELRKRARQEINRLDRIQRRAEDSKIKEREEKVRRNFNLTDNKLPPEPVPGQYYRTKDGRKVYFIGKSIKGLYLYEDLDNDWLEYTRPFQYWQEEGDNFYDIIAPWTEPLPEMEIKRWAVVYSVNHGVNGRHKRGGVVTVQGSKSQAEKCLVYNSEIVELTGTLPAWES
jgi:hypothetical protein